MRSWRWRRTRPRSSTTPRRTARSRRSSSPRARRPRSGSRSPCSPGPARSPHRRSRSASNGAPPVAARPNATPVARRTALELGVSLHGIAGTGPGGRITREDVQRAAADGAAPAPAAPAADGRGDVSVLELTPTQSTIARRMAQSAATIPVFTVSIDADVSQIVALRKSRRETAPSLNDFVVKAAALTLREFPRFNASYADGAVHCFSRVNVGIAVATDDALLVPVVVDADQKTLVGDLRRDAQARGGRPQPVAAAGGAARRHVHRLEPRHVRRALVHGDRRSAAGRDPRRRRRRRRTR